MNDSTFKFDNGALIEEKGDHGPDKNRRESIGYVWSGVE
jgi:hypothetical protein